MFASLEFHTTLMFSFFEASCASCGLIFNNTFVHENMALNEVLQNDESKNKWKHSIVLKFSKCSQSKEIHVQAASPSRVEYGYRKKKESRISSAYIIKF